MSGFVCLAGRKSATTALIRCAPGPVELLERLSIGQIQRCEANEYRKPPAGTHPEDDLARFEQSIGTVLAWAPSRPALRAVPVASARSLP